MIYDILEGKEVVNTIVSETDFVEKYCAENGYTFRAAGDIPTAQEPDKTPTEAQILGQEITAMELESIAQGQKQTSMELALLEQGQYITEMELEELKNV